MSPNSESHRVAVLLSPVMRIKGNLIQTIKPLTPLNIFKLVAINLTSQSLPGCAHPVAQFDRAPNKEQPLQHVMSLDRQVQLGCATFPPHSPAGQVHNNIHAAASGYGLCLCSDWLSQCEAASGHGPCLLLSTGCDTASGY